MKVCIPARLRLGAQWTDAFILNVSSRGLLIQSTEAVERGMYVEVRRDNQVIIGRIVWRSGSRAGLRSQDRVPLEAIVTAGAARSAARKVRNASRTAGARRAATISTSAAGSWPSYGIRVCRRDRSASISRGRVARCASSGAALCQGPHRTCRSGVVARRLEVALKLVRAADALPVNEHLRGRVHAVPLLKASTSIRVPRIRSSNGMPASSRSCLPEPRKGRRGRAGPCGRESLQYRPFESPCA